jgi:Family of unknown function (DUF6879)
MPDLAWWLQNFKRSAFRLETLPEYDVPQEAEMLAAFKRGRPIQLPDDHPWLLTVRQHCGAAKTMQRVRIVSSPLTDYERFELLLYRLSHGAGEDVRISNSVEIRNYGDWWLFDGEAVIVLKYDATGRFLGTEQASDVVRYRRIRDLVLENSIPFADFTARATRQ